MDPAGRQQDALLRVPEEAALCPQLDDHIPDTAVQEDPGHLFRCVLSGVISRLILIRSDNVDQRQGFRDILQRQEVEVRELRIRDHDESLFLRCRHNRSDHRSVVKGCAEQRSEDQRASVPETRRVVLRVEVIAVRSVRDGLSRSVVPHKHGRHRRGMLRRPYNQRGIHPAAPERIRHHVPGPILSERAENRGPHPQLGRGHGLVHRFPAHVQTAGGGAVARGGNRLRVKTPDD